MHSTFVYRSIWIAVLRVQSVEQCRQTSLAIDVIKVAIKGRHPLNMASHSKDDETGTVKVLADQLDYRIFYYSIVLS